MGAGASAGKGPEEAGPPPPGTDNKITFLLALTHPTVRTYVKKFMFEKVYVGELYDFVAACKEFEKTLSSLEAMKSKPDQADAHAAGVTAAKERRQQIVDKYIKAGAEEQVNLSGGMRTATLAKCEGDALTPGCFAEAEAECLKIIETDIWPKFQEDELGKQLLKEKVVRMMCLTF